MANYWYLGPFRCEEALYLFIHEITPHLDRAGVSFHVPERTGVVSPGVYRRQAGEETAKIILKASGKDFVPVTRGEYIDRAVSLGFFPGNTKWDAPLTNGDAAVLIMKLKSLLERG